MSTGTKVELHIAAAVAERFCADLAPYCQRIAVAGSLRRKATMVGDIEIVAIPKTMIQRALDGEEKTHSLLDDHLADLLAQRLINDQPPQPGLRKAWGEKYKKMWININHRRGLIQVDLFITTPETWGAIYLIRTGPAEFGQALMGHINANTSYQQRDGGLHRRDTGTLVPTPEEKDYFEAAGLLFLPPERRTVEELKRAAARWIKGGAPKRRMAAQQAKAGAQVGSQPPAATQYEAAENTHPVTVGEPQRNDSIPVRATCYGSARRHAAIQACLEADSLLWMKRPIERIAPPCLMLSTWQIWSAPMTS